MIALDIAHMPYSRFGSYLAVSLLPARGEVAAGVWLRNVHGDAAREVLRVEVLEDGQPVAAEVAATPAEVQLRTPAGCVRICLSGVNRVRVRGEGVGFRLTARPGTFNCAVPQTEDRWLLNISTAFQNYLLQPLAGTVTVDAPWDVARCRHIIVTGTPESEAVIDQGVGSWQPAPVTTTFAEDAAALAAEFNAFVAGYPRDDDQAATTELAAYLNWSTVVAPCGFFTRPAMLMSKNHMTNVWSWDHAFNAMALSPVHPALAWDTFMLMFDHQQPSGQLPDFINDVVRLYNFVKPPVHGWVYRRMCEAHPWFSDRAVIEELYAPLCRWTDWWFAYRNPDGDGLPQYHHGNDSGWDNGTVFDVGLPVKGADLAALLTLQMDVLAEMARAMDRPDDAAAWAQRADALLARLLDRMWDGRKFVCPSVLDGRVTEASDSIFGCLPILLGPRLPRDVQQGLVAQIRRHLTPWGLATEHPDSTLYQTDGYWRGPIWAPPTLMIVDGLRAIGEDSLALEITERFCNLCAHSGFAENFDPISGAALRDKAYTWTSSVFLELNRYRLQQPAHA